MRSEGNAVLIDNAATRTEGNAVVIDDVAQRHGVKAEVIDDAATRTEDSAVLTRAMVVRVKGSEAEAARGADRTRRVAAVTGGVATSSEDCAAAIGEMGERVEVRTARA